MGVMQEGGLSEGSRVWIAGHQGMLGQALMREMQDRNVEIVTVGRAEVDLRRQADVENWLANNPIDGVVIAAATVGGILANNSYPVDFIYDNLAITTNIIHAASQTGVRKLVNVGSSCMYPRLAAQPVSEAAILTGPLEPTNEWFAVAKIAALKLCQAYRRQFGHDFITVIPTNLYGPGDNFDLQASHVVPALLRKMETAREDGGPVEIWGTGKPRREFMYVDDAAAAIASLMAAYSEEEPINISGGETVSVMELAELAADVVGYRGAFRTDESKPDGMPVKQLDNTRISGLNIWRPKVELRDGLGLTYDWYRREYAPESR